MQDFQLIFRSRSARNSRTVPRLVIKARHIVTRHAARYLRTHLHIAGRYARKSRYFFGKLYLQDSANVVDADIAVRQSSRSTAANVQSFVEFLGNNRTVISGKLHAVVQGCHFMISCLVFVNNASNTVRTVDAGLTFFNMNVYTVRAVNTVYTVFTVNTDGTVFSVFTRNGYRFSRHVFAEGYVNNRVGTCLFNGRLNIRAVAFNGHLRTQGTRLFTAHIGIKAKSLVRNFFHLRVKLALIDRIMTVYGVLDVCDPIIRDADISARNSYTVAAYTRIVIQDNTGITVRYGRNIRQILRQGNRNFTVIISRLNIRIFPDNAQGRSQVLVNYSAVISDKVHTLGRQVVRHIRRRIRYGIIYLIRQVVYVYDFASVVTRRIGYIGNMRAARLIDVRTARHGDGVFIHDAV